MPESEWRKSMAEMKEYFKKFESAGIGINDPNSFLTVLDPALEAFADAARKYDSKEDVAKALEEHFKKLVDGAFIEYVKVDRPDLVAAGKDPGGAAKFKIYLEVWDESFMRKHGSEFDLDDKALEARTAKTRKNMKALLDQLVPLEAKKTEDEIQSAS
jgi:BMFP domain-containing protein YqiC